MDQFIITTAKLLPYPRRASISAGLASAFHHEAGPAEAELGDLCAVIEVFGNSKEASDVTNLVWETSRRQYYDNNALEPSERFEETVKAVNRELATYATRGNSAWIGKISAVIAVITGADVHLTQTGSAQAYLYRSGKDTCITTGLGSKEPQRPSKTFANIASGRVASGDRLMLATPALMHQLSSQELSTIISDNSAAAAVSKLHGLLKDSEAQERIAATITEISTAEAAALRPQSGLPKEAHLGKPEGLAETARHRAKPVLAVIRAFAIKSWQSATTIYKAKVRPFLKRSTLALVRGLRRLLSHRNGRISLGVGAAIVLVLIVLFARGSGSNKALAALASKYHDAYTKQSTAADQLAGGDKLGAKTNFQAADDELNVILKDPKAGQLDAYLASHPHSDNDPASAAKLLSSVESQIDQIDGLTKVNPGQLADFSALGNAKPTMMEQVGNQFVFVNPSGGSSIYRYDTSKAKLEVVATHPKGLGKVVATATASAGDGVYLLTDQPAVWFYSTTSGTLTQKPITSGSWPKGQAIASYGGNLYILAADNSALYKVSPTAGGFAAPVAYAINDPSVLKNAKVLAVDGSIYLGTDKGISRIFAGVVQKSDLSFPTNLLNPRAIVSTDAGKLLISTDAQSNRIGLFNFGGTLDYSRQLQIKGANTVYKASSSNEDNVLYALVDQKFVKIKY